MTATRDDTLRILLLEVNEADAHFLDKWTRSGELPALARMMSEGCRARTRVPGWDGRAERAWRSISPWIVWPSLYTGLTPEEHGLVAFGQDRQSVVGRCVWDVLDGAGVSTGVFGSLQSYPPRNQGHCQFYLPEALADDADAFPASLVPLQEFFILGARNYSESFLGMAVEATALLSRTTGAGVRKRSILRTLAQVPAELVVGDRAAPERANLHTYLSADAFLAQYRSARPRFATVHMNHVAYMQHRYWRAAEPERFADDLGPADGSYFGSVRQRRRHEHRHKDRILRAFQIVDRIVAGLMAEVDDDTVILLATGLGQHPMDPATGKIHIPVLRFVEPEQLLAKIGVRAERVLHQMNPDLTLDFIDDVAARTAAERIEGLYIESGQSLFDVECRGSQVFIEMHLPPSVWASEGGTIRHEGEPLAEPWQRWIRVSANKEQSTAHHHDNGLLLAWSRGRPVALNHATMPITDVAPSILSWFGVPIPEWMNASPVVPFEVR